MTVEFDQVSVEFDQMSVEFDQMTVLLVLVVEKITLLDALVVDLDF